ncbi:hypothetical protein [Moumouvirus maliensis]|nr:hypothetical protein [Moumouvirus maliensis]
MGNTSSSRSASNTGMIIGGIFLAPVTGGWSLLALVPAAVRTGAEIKINWRETKVNDCIGNSSYLDSKVKNVEVRFCHIGEDWEDAGLTLAGRSLFMTTDACHHWFIIVEIEGLNDYVYIDKHFYRNIIIRKNKDGKNGGGNGWFSSDLKWRSDVKRWNGNVTLRELIDYVKRDEHKNYHLIDDNCQDFAEKVYNWLT